MNILTKIPNPGFFTHYNIMPEDFPAPWASAYGDDEFGYWMELTIKDAVQRFRWIHPGEFLMGSPSDEEDRIDEREAQHPIILTKGYWLADTSCTQAFWEAVMGENPSYFDKTSEASNLPVEQISWEDCQQVIKRLNGEIKGLQLRLPSEAEWEYACRAGNASPFSFGESLDSSQANFNGGYPYKAEKGEFRQRTVEVKSFESNAWGLYQMHGNVWEWCLDWYRDDYEADVLKDPVGPGSGKDRVLRGGSWRIEGLWLRSAFRAMDKLDVRDSYVGVRFAGG